MFTAFLKFFFFKICLIFLTPVMLILGTLFSGKVVWWLAKREFRKLDEYLDQPEPEKK